MKLQIRLKSTFFVVFFLLAGCGAFEDNATKFRSVIEAEAFLLNYSVDLDKSESHTGKASYFPYLKSPYRLILIPSQGASKSELLKKGVPLSIANALFRQMKYLGTVGDNYFLGDWIIVWNEKKKEPSWTGSDIHAREVLYISKGVEKTEITLQKIGQDKIVILSLE